MARETALVHTLGRFMPPELFRSTPFSGSSRRLNCEEIAESTGEYHPGNNPENQFEMSHRWLLDRVSARLDRIRYLVMILVIMTLVVIGGCFVGLATTLCIQGFTAGSFTYCGVSGVNIPVVVALVVAIAMLVLYGFVTWLLTASVDYGDNP